MLGPDKFLLLNVEGICAAAPQWQGLGRPKLWTYNLHYFDDINAANAAARSAWHERLVERWIVENPPGYGIGWEPYPVSRRTVNWMKWSLRGNDLSAQAWHSLAVQARWLNRRLEWHLQGNHLIANAKALIFAGLFFQGEEADRWLLRGLQIMRAQVAEQVLADGGHFERSPMYQAGVLEDLLDSVNMLRAYGRSVDAAWLEAVPRMISWLEAMSHPDGDIAFFNDAAFGISANPTALLAYAARLGIALEATGSAGLRLLMPSGYVSIESPPFRLLCDIAPVGPDHLPAHAHADTLSFELSVYGRRVFVNSGTSEYGTGAERQRQRGTAAHNTLVIDNEDSSEVWAGFRVARRSRARLLDARHDTSRFIVAGEHDGYRRLRGRNLHRRSWRMTEQELFIEDVVEGRFRSAACYFHLHPAIRVQHARGSELQLADSQGMLLEMHFEGAASVDVVDSTWHPRFGVLLASRCVVARLDGPRLATSILRRGLN